MAGHRLALTGEVEMTQHNDGNISEFGLPEGDFWDLGGLMAKKSRLASSPVARAFGGAIARVGRLDSERSRRPDSHNHNGGCRVRRGRVDCSPWVQRPRSLSRRSIKRAGGTCDDAWIATAGWRNSGPERLAGTASNVEDTDCTRGFGFA